MIAAETVAAVIADQLLADSVEVVLTASEARIVLATLMPATYLNLDQVGEAVAHVDVQMVSPRRETIQLDRDHAYALSEAGHLILNRGRA